MALHRYDKLRDKVIEIILDYENLAKLWAEIVGDGDTCDSNVVAQALATKFSFTTERDAAERVAHMLNDGGVSVQCESLPKFMIYLVSINQFMEVYGTATTERISSIAFKRMMSKLGIQQTQEQLDAVRHAHMSFFDILAHFRHSCCAGISQTCPERASSVVGGCKQVVFTQFMHTSRRAALYNCKG